MDKIEKLKEIYSTFGVSAINMILDSIDEDFLFSYYTTNQNILNGQSPYDWLKNGRLEEIVKNARNYLTKNNK